MGFFEKVFDILAELSTKLPAAGVKAYFICALTFLLGLGLIIGFTYFGASAFKLKKSCKKIIDYLAKRDEINDDNVGDFTEQCFSNKAPKSLRDTWIQYLGVRFGYPCDIVSERNVYEREVKKVNNVRANVFLGTALILLAVFAFWGFGNLPSYEMSVIHFCGLILTGIIYLILVIAGRTLNKSARETFYIMQEDLDAKVNFQVEKNYATDASPLLELAALTDGIIAKNIAKPLDSDDETVCAEYSCEEDSGLYPEETPIDLMIRMSEEKDATVTDAAADDGLCEICDTTENEAEFAEATADTESDLVDGSEDSVASAEEAFEVQPEVNAEDCAEESEFEQAEEKIAELDEACNSSDKNADESGKDENNENKETETSEEKEELFPQSETEVLETEEDGAQAKTDESDIQPLQLGSDAEEVENVEPEDVETETDEVIDEEVADETNRLDSPETETDGDLPHNDKEEEVLGEYADSVKQEDPFFEYASEDGSEPEEAESVTADLTEDDSELTDEEKIDKENLSDVGNDDTDEIENQQKDGIDMFGKKKLKEAQPTATQAEALEQDYGMFVEGEIDEKEFVEAEIEVEEQIADTELSDVDALIEEEIVEEKLEAVDDELQPDDTAPDLEETQEFETDETTADVTEELVEEKPIEEATAVAEETEEKPIEEAAAVAEEAEEIVYVQQDADEDEEIVPAKLSKLPLLLDYMTAQPMSRSMKIKVASLLLMAYDKFKNSPADKDILRQCMMRWMMTLKSNA